jgi:hypothetical protein
MSTVPTAQPLKGVGEPCAAYESVEELWERSRAVCGGERYVKAADNYLDVLTYSNMLIPFSPNMTPEQYAFYKAEAELPGIVSQFSKFVVGGLLRKQPHLEMPKGAPEEAQQWILDDFGQDSSPLSAFLDVALWEEIQTSRAWVYVDYPNVANAEDLTKEEQLAYKPYPILWKAESVINWKVSTDVVKGTQSLSMVIVKGYEEDFSKNEFHAEILDTLWVHEIVEGKYQIRKFQHRVPTQTETTQGQTKVGTGQGKKYELVETIANFLVAGKPLDFIPAWPLNGSIDVTEPVIMALVDKEVNLYNKLSRRNHLLYGAATYTPVLSTNVSDETFQAIVDGGLGSWIRLMQGDTASILDTPTDALKDMEAAIASGIEEMARMGIRMLSPENVQSGVALEIRNAAQAAQLGTLNTKVSNVMADVICFMVNWRYGTAFKSNEFDFSLSADFNPAPLGDAWLRLITEWYKEGLIPRTTWLEILKHNDIIPPDYNDEDAKVEITADDFLMPKEPKQGTTKPLEDGVIGKVE